LPAVEKRFTAYDIAMAFHTDKILIPSVITIEHGFVTNSVYIGIQQWHDTEAAYNFIASLSNPSIETLYGNGDGGSWLVEVNLYSHKLVNTGSKNRSVHYLAPSYFTYEEDEEDEEDEEQQPAPLQRQSAAWGQEDMDGCIELFGQPLTFENEDRYFSYVEERNAWVDQLLEKMESDERYRYEQPAIQDENRPHFDDDFGHAFDDEDDEDDEELRRKDFEQDANDWYNDMMEQKIEAKRTMNPRQFDAWQKNFDKNLTHQQFGFQLFLQTGLLPKY
jgi:hypothetical protein